MTPRHTTTGNRNPHVVAPGYRRESDRSAAWHRPGVWERFVAAWRGSPAFERCLVVGMIAMTAGTIAYCTWSSM